MNDISDTPSTDQVSLILLLHHGYTHTHMHAHILLVQVIIDLSSANLTWPVGK